MTDEVRVIRWLSHGYEDAFTQYTIEHRDHEIADLWITQISLRDNMARRMQTARPSHQVGPVETMRSLVESLIANRLEDGQAEEVLSA